MASAYSGRWLLTMSSRSNVVALLRFRRDVYDGVGVCAVPHTELHMIRMGVDDLKGKTEAQRAAYVRRRLEAAVQQGDDWSPRSRLPTIAPLAQLLPDGLACGAVVDYRGAVSPLLGMLAVASAAGLDIALVNLPARQGLAAGLLAAQEMGGVLTRMYTVASPERELATVVNTLLDGLALVIVGVGDAVPSSVPIRLGRKVRVAESGDDTVTVLGTARFCCHDSPANKIG